MSREARGLLAAGLVAAPVLVGVAYALAGAMGRAGAGAGAGGGWAPIGRTLADPAVWEGTLWSVWVAGAATALATGGAMLVAVAFRGPGRLARWGQLLAVAPLPVPHVAAGALGVLILGQSGLLARAGHAIGLVAAPAEMPALVYDQWGVGLILTLAWKELAFLALVAFSVLSARAPGLEETARSLGADAGATFRRVTLPVLWRGMMPAVVAVLVFAFGSYETAVLLAPSDPLALPLLAMERYTDASVGRRSEAFTLVLVMLAVSALAVAAHQWARSRWGSLQ